MTAVLPIVPRPRVLDVHDGGSRIAQTLLVFSEDPAVRAVLAAVGDLGRKVFGVDVVPAPRAQAHVVIETHAQLPVDPEAVPPATGIDPVTGGLSTGSADQGRETYLIDHQEGGPRIRVVAPEGAFRALITLLQSVRKADAGRLLPNVTIADGPQYAWRGLSLDVARHFFTVAEVERIIDLLALNKLNVLHLHLSDTQAWRLQLECRPKLTCTAPGADREFYSSAEFTHLVAYAANRFVTVVPELDMPGHTAAAISAYPELQAREPAHPHLQFLDPRAPGTLDFAREVITELAGLTPGPYLHIGGDEAFGMPQELYDEFMRESVGFARAAGKRVVGWQESVRSGGLGGSDAIQCWVSGSDTFDADALKERAPQEYHALIDIAAQSFALAPGDMPLAAHHGVPVILSPSASVYLDRKYAEPSHEPAQTQRLEQLGFPNYTPRASRDLLSWSVGDQPELTEAGATVGGVEAAIWCETVTGFDDLAMLLLPRLPILADRFWNPSALGPEDLLKRLSGHPAHWAALGFDAYYRSTDVFGSAPPRVGPNL